MLKQFMINPQQGRSFLFFWNQKSAHSLAQIQKTLLLLPSLSGYGLFQQKRDSLVPYPAGRDGRDDEDGI
jgi:hypothetical protein